MMRRTAVRSSAQVLAGLEDPLELLAPYERSRHDALHRAADRADFLAAHLLVRELAGAALGWPAAAVTIVQRCEHCGGPHGRPAVAGAAGLWAGLSHAAGWVAAAVADRPVGIDVEPAGAQVPASALTPTERAGLEEDGGPVAGAGVRGAAVRLWVRKEALVKAGAARLDEVAVLDARPDRIRGYDVLDLAAPAGAIAALATGTPEAG